MVRDAELSNPQAIEDRPSAIEWPALDEKTKKRLHAVLTWQYRFRSATQREAKSSVTALRRQAEELDNEAKPIFKIPSGLAPSPPSKSSGRSRSQPKSISRHPQLTAAAIGTSHHKFLQYCSLENTGSLKSLAAEAKHLEHKGILSAAEVAFLDLAAIAAFWASSEGKKILAQRKRVQRELPFTAKFSPKEVDAIIGAKTPPGLEDEFVVVQGVADLVVLLTDEIWLVDFKTDEIKLRELAGRGHLYQPQLKLYAKALSRIYSRPVTNCWLHFLAARQTVNLRI